MRIVVLLALAACAKASDGDSCPALSVTVDGVPLPAMTHGYALSSHVNGRVQWVVDVSTVDRGCDRYMAKDGRILEDGEQNVSASIGVTSTVGIANLAVTSDRVNIVGAPPSKPGDKLALCVTDASFGGEFDVYKGKTIAMTGKLEGTYCGEQKNN